MPECPCCGGTGEVSWCCPRCEGTEWGVEDPTLPVEQWMIRCHECGHVSPYPEEMRGPSGPDQS